MHNTVQENLSVRCSRCGTTRQRHVALAMQKCPVRTCWQEQAEKCEGTAVYAVWVAGLKAMHGVGGRGIQQPAVAAADAATVHAVAVGPQAAAERSEPALAPRAVCLRPYRAHVVVKVGEAELCMLCFSRAQRYKVAAWRDGCCDGAAPLESCPKHLLCVFATCPILWPPRREERGAAILVYARQCRDSHALQALRPPKRRVVAARHAATTNLDAFGSGGDRRAGAAVCL